jgi:hypothetical protein
MPVDMYERRFRQELEKLPPFSNPYPRDVRVWAQDFPAWRAIFTGICLYEHSCGYRLPSQQRYFEACRNAWCKQHPDAARFQPFFKGNLLPGMRQRVGVWYESGMAETHLYACLVEAIEDKLKEGVVLYDARADWKLKADLVVSLLGQQIRVNAYFGDRQGRPAIEARREKLERIRKINTAESAHWGNKELPRMLQIEVARTDADALIINGVRLFPPATVNALLREIYEHVGLHQGYFFPEAPCTTE